MEKNSTKSLANRIFQHNKYYFNTASIGLVGELQEHKEGWDIAVKNVCNAYAKFLTGKITDSNNIHIFHNTTAAIQRVFHILNKRLNNSKSNLLTTDAEFPGILAALYEIWSGEIHVAKIDNLIWSGNSEKVVEYLRKAILLTKPKVFFISHVLRASGFTIPLLDLINFIKKIDPNIVIVIDGAQAVGNIKVDNSILNKVDFYVTSAHKWLCGATTLGLAYAKFGWDIMDPAQGYSLKLCSGGTGILEVLYSVIDSLQDFRKMEEIEKYNRYLSNLFIDELENVNKINFYKFPNETDRNGIVTFKMNSELSNDFFRFGKGDKEYFPLTFLKKENYLGEDTEGNNEYDELFLRNDRYRILFEEPNKPISWFKLSHKTEIPNEGVFRTCFHYYHSPNDVLQFANFIKGKLY